MPTSSYQSDPAIEAEVQRISTLDVDALRDLYRTTFGRPPARALTKDLIRRMIAYRIQEKAYGGLDRETLKVLNGYTRGQSAALDAPRRLKTGTVLVREYRGERHNVTIIPGGFVWRETTYGSLSTIARAITGTRWNGPRFFGLRSTEADIAADVGAPGDGASNELRARRAGRRPGPPRRLQASHGAS